MKQPAPWFAEADKRRIELEERSQSGTITGLDWEELLRLRTECREELERCYPAPGKK